MKLWMKQSAKAPAARQIIVLLCAVTTILLSGCNSLRSWKANGFKVGPSYCPPAASLEMEWIDLQSEPRLSADEPPGIAAWWYALNDPVLNELIEMAYGQNLTLRQAGTRIQQAQAVRGIAVGNLFPQFQQAIGDYQRIQVSQNNAGPSPLRRFDQWDLGHWPRQPM